MAVFALDKLAHKVAHLGDSTVAELSLGDRALGSRSLRDWLLVSTSRTWRDRLNSQPIPQRPWGVLCLEI